MWRRPLGLFLLLILAGIGCRSGTDTADAQRGTSASGGPVDEYTTQPARIYVDGRGNDWADRTVRHADTGDGTGVGLERLWMAHTEEHLFLRLELSQPVNLQEDNALTLFLDTDDDSTTGRPAQGLGAELSWTFGERAGRFKGTEIGHAAIGLTSLPTVRAEVFEMALDRDAAPAGAAPLFQGDSLRIALSSDGDRLPDEEGGLGYVLSDAATTLETPSLNRPGASAVRLVSYNAVNNFDRELNSLFIEERQPSYRRIFRALGPDVIALQEVYDQTAARVEETAESTLGFADEWTWKKQGQDLVLGSRFPILDTHAIPGYEEYESGAFLLDAREALGSRLVVVNMHPPCCNYEAEGGDPSSDAQRQRVVDGVMAFVRAVKNGEGPFGVPSDLPIAILGDMNFVGSAQQPRTLRTGEIVNQDDFGPSVTPDWDDTPLLDSRPRQIGSPMHVTWIDTESSFPPGRLDYVYVTDSVLEVTHEFVLHTPVLPEEVLQTHDLQPGDTKAASDHLPVVVDVEAR